MRAVPYESKLSLVHQAQDKLMQFSEAMLLEGTQEECSDSG